MAVEDPAVDIDVVIEDASVELAVEVSEVVIELETVKICIVEREVRSHLWNFPSRKPSIRSLIIFNLYPNI